MNSGNLKNHWYWIMVKIKDDVYCLCLVGCVAQWHFGLLHMKLQILTILFFKNIILNSVKTCTQNWMCLSSWSKYVLKSRRYSTNLLNLFVNKIYSCFSAQHCSVRWLRGVHWVKRYWIKPFHDTLFTACKQ